MEDFAWLVVFIGRPNAGKSSLISQLTRVNPTVGRKPGSTRKINEYALTKRFKVVDVPGWGKIHSRTKDYEDYIKDEIIDYFETNKSYIPACIHVIDAKSLIDVSERLSKKNIIPIDQELYFFLKNMKLKPIVALNKIDKVSPKELEDALKYFKKLIDYNSLPKELQESIVTVSAKQGKKLAPLRDLIRSRLQETGIEEYERYIKLK